MISFTEKALEVMADAVTDDSQMIRVSVRGGGCSGFMYGVEVEENPREDDLVIEFEGVDVKICMDPKSSFMLDKTIVDYESTLASSGFKFVNENATKTCGCGQSFGCG